MIILSQKEPKMDTNFLTDLDLKCAEFTTPIFQEANKQDIDFEFVGPRGDKLEEIAKTVFAALKVKDLLETDYDTPIAT
jgi:hypothetical protein